MDNLQTPNILSALLKDWKTMAKEANFITESNKDVRSCSAVDDTEKKAAYTLYSGFGGPRNHNSEHEVSYSDLKTFKLMMEASKVREKNKKQTDALGKTKPKWGSSNLEDCVIEIEKSRKLIKDSHIKKIDSKQLQDIDKIKPSPNIIKRKSAVKHKEILNSERK